MLAVSALPLPAGSDHETLLLGEDASAGYRGILAVHSTRLGPAVGGTRLWSYATLEDAVTDVLRLARGMTYKNAAAGLPLGGGKSVILRPEGPLDREKVFQAHGRFIERQGGRYVTAEDVGSTPADMAIVRRETRHVAGLEGLSGDPSPFTARGVFRAIEGAAAYRWGSSDLAGRRFGLQGCGNVGYQLALQLKQAGADLVVADVDPARSERLVREVAAVAVDPRRVHAEILDGFVPCALGGTLNAQTIPQLRCEIVVGAANNQLLAAEDAERLRARGILYVPDYIANAGGVINGSREILGWPEQQAWARLERIRETVLELCAAADRDQVTTAAAADRLALSRLSTG